MAHNFTSPPPPLVQDFPSLDFNKITTELNAGTKTTSCILTVSDLDMKEVVVRDTRCALSTRLVYALHTLGIDINEQINTYHLSHLPIGTTVIHCYAKDGLTSGTDGYGRLFLGRWLNGKFHPHLVNPAALVEKVTTSLSPEEIVKRHIPKRRINLD